MERKVTLEMFSTMFDTHLIKRAGLELTSQVLHWTTMIMITILTNYTVNVHSQFSDALITLIILLYRNAFTDDALLLC